MSSRFYCFSTFFLAVFFAFDFASVSIFCIFVFFAIFIYFL